MNFNTQLLAAIHHKMAAMAAVLTLVEAPQLCIEYSGCGDSGEAEGVDLDWPEGTEPKSVTHAVEWMSVFHAVYGESSTFELRTKTVPFDQACEDLLNMVIEQSGHSGWENNDGGGGSMTVTAAGALTLNHFDNVTEQDHSDYEFHADDGEDEADEVLQAA